jgi:hypothetical protein
VVVARPDPNSVSALPSYIERVAPAVIGIRVEVPVQFVRDAFAAAAESNFT